MSCKRGIRITSFDEYGVPFVYTIDWERVPVFFHNRPQARLTKIELLDIDETKVWPNREKVIQTIEETPKKIEAYKAFNEILTVHNLKKEIEK